MNLIRSPGDFITLLLFLAVIGVVPFVIALLFGRHRSHHTDLNLQECRKCGAQNHKAKERCYCCGCDLVLPQPHEASAEVIRRVKLADDSRKKREAETLTSRSVEDTSQRAGTTRQVE